MRWPSPAASPTTIVFMHQGKVWEMGPSAKIFGAPETAELKQFLGGGLK